jgi:hypothetical protein
MPVKVARSTFAREWHADLTLLKIPLHPTSDSG